MFLFAVRTFGFCRLRRRRVTRIMAMMMVVKNIVLGFACCLMLASTVANAALPCCHMGDAPQQPEMHMQTHDSRAMPCHEMAADAAAEQTTCHDCDCSHCTQVTPLPAFSAAALAYKPHVSIFTAVLSYAGQAEPVFQPPKRFS